MLNLDNASIDFGLLLPEITLCVAGFAILLLGVSIRNRAINLPLSVLALGLALFFSVADWGNSSSGFFGLVSKDSFSAIYNLIFLVSGIISLIIAKSYLESRGIDRPEFYALTLFSIVGMMIMASSFDLIVIFLGLEIMSIPLYVLAGFEKDNPKSNEASIKYFIMGAFATGFLLYGIAMIYGAAGTTDLRIIAENFQTLKLASPLFIYTGAALTLVGFAFKVAAVPFHMWVPDVYEGAPTPVTAFFSVGPKAAGFAALMRIFVYGFDQLRDLEPFFWTIAVLTMIIGNLLALRQDNVKRMLAYSSIAHAGYIMVALTVGGSDAVASGIYYLLAYTFFNLGGFTILTMLDTRAGAQSRFEELRGMSTKHPYLAALLALFMFALAGFPPTAGFFGKFFIFSAAVEHGFIWLAIIGLMTSFVSVYYYLRVVVYCFFNKPDRPFEAIITTPMLLVALIVTAVGVLGLGLFPDDWVNLSREAFLAFL